MSLEKYLELHKKSYLVFDLDETIMHLILPWDIYFNPIKNQLIKFNQSFFEEYEKGEIYINDLENRYVSRYGEKVKKILKKNRITFESEKLQNVLVNNSLIEFIKKAQAYSLFLWTNNTRQVIEKVLKQQYMYDAFKKIVTYNDMTFLKPNPEGFAKIYDKNIPKDQYLFIGDSLGDKNAAKNVGIDFYYVNYFKDPNIKYSY